MLYCLIKIKKKILVNDLFPLRLSPFICESHSPVWDRWAGHGGIKTLNPFLMESADRGDVGPYLNGRCRSWMHPVLMESADRGDVGSRLGGGCRSWRLWGFTQLWSSFNGVLASFLGQWRCVVWMINSFWVCGKMMSVEGSRLWTHECEAWGWSTLNYERVVTMSMGKLRAK